ncbi:uncharacterized protein A4U43_C02F20640 [Asparagus officinalis]|uniref:Uncharacterized protein n=1 Tax=Asparagus officinalis TaxID=4686 RepID=A0A5P1FLL4_ASPOF|nr:uncharacterized protein A4U43_C02F20640 [Asparagus officinalis]
MRTRRRRHIGNASVGNHRSAALPSEDIRRPDPKRCRHTGVKIGDFLTSHPGGFHPEFHRVVMTYRATIRQASHRSRARNSQRSVEKERRRAKRQGRSAQRIAKPGPQQTTYHSGGMSAGSPTCVSSDLRSTPTPRQYDK